MVNRDFTAYQAGRMFTKAAKIYLTSKVITGTFSKFNKISKHHKINSENSEVVTENLFECLKYLD